MKNEPDPNSTNPVEIEALIARLEQGQLRAGDAQLLGRLLRLLLRLIALLQQKNASLARLKRMLFGPGSDKRTAPESRTEPPPGATASGAPAESERSPDSGSDSGQACAGDQKPKRAGHGRKAASAYTAPLGTTAGTPPGTAMSKTSQTTSWTTSGTTSLTTSGTTSGTLPGAQGQGYNALHPSRMMDPRSGFK